MSKWNKPEIKSEIPDAVKKVGANGKNLATEAGIASTFQELKERNNENVQSCTTINVTPENAKSILNENILQNEDIKSADLILIYRDNTCYTKLNHDLESLLKKWKYGWKIVCIAIDKSMHSLEDVERLVMSNGFDFELLKSTLWEKELSILTQMLKEHRCITDHTISTRTHERTENIDDIADNIKLDGGVEEKVSGFIKQSQKISEICDEKWIKTIYLVDRAYGRDTFLLTHWWLCEKADGTIYNIKGIILCDDEAKFQKLKNNPRSGFEIILKWSKGHREIVEDAKRYWTNMFPNKKVVFIESSDWKNLMNEVDGGTQSLLIVDRHGDELKKNFKNYILYAWYEFEPDWWYEEFMHDWDIKLWLNAENILKYLEEKGERNNKSKKADN